MALLHKAHQVVTHLERAWSDSDKQAATRAAQIVVMLARFGMLKDVGEIRADMVFQPEPEGQPHKPPPASPHMSSV